MKLRLDDWAPVPQKRETGCPTQNETEVFPVSAEQIDGDREELPEYYRRSGRETAPDDSEMIRRCGSSFFVFLKNAQV